MKKNYQIILDQELEKISSLEKRPSLLLHSCCAPCSSYVLEYLSKYFNITVFYYNPNIFPREEFIKRAKEQEHLISQMGLDIAIEIGDFEDSLFYETVKGLENAREGGQRCIKCFELRLSKAAEFAKKNNFDYFATTLTVSPHKNADLLNQIGQDLSQKYGVKYLFSDFKKREGYKRSIELSKIYDLYRQNYCGCKFSMSHLN